MDESTATTATGGTGGGASGARKAAYGPGKPIQQVPIMPETHVADGEPTSFKRFGS